MDVRLSGAREGEGVRGWSLRDVSSDDLDGLSTARSDAPEREPAPAHPNGVIAIDHVVAFSGDLDRTVAVLQGAGSTCGGSARSRRRRARRARRSSGSGGRSSRSCRSLTAHSSAAGARSAPARLWGLALLADGR